MEEIKNKLDSDKEFLIEFLDRFSNFVKNFWHPHNEEYFTELEYQEFEYDFLQEGDAHRFICYFVFKLKKEDNRRRFVYISREYIGEIPPTYYKNLYNYILKIMMFGEGPLSMLNILTGKGDINYPSTLLGRGEPVILENIIKELNTEENGQKESI